MFELAVHETENISKIRRQRPVHCRRGTADGKPYIMNNGLNDQLVAVAKTKSKTAFADLFNECAPRVKAFMLKRGCDNSTAEELAQMTFVTVWRKAHMYDPQKAPALTWIFTIARNLHIDMVRKENRPEPSAEDPFFKPEPDPSADMMIAAKQDAHGLRKAIAQLTAEQQEVLKLSFYEDKSHGEIAASLGQPLGTVKSRIRLALKKIRDTLDKNETIQEPVGGLE